MAVLTPRRMAPRDTGRPQQGSWPLARPSASAPHRLPGADALRALAAVAVVVIHASYWPAQSHGAERSVWGSVTLLARFAVPAFVLLAGLVLGFRHGGRRLGPDFLLRRARRSLLPWLIWAPVFCVADLVWVGTVSPSWSSVRDFFATGAGHLYFLVLVPQLYVLLLLWPSRRRPLAAVTGLAVAVQVAISAVRLFVPLGSGALHQVMLTYGYELFPFWIGYFALGVVAGRWLAGRRGRGLPAWPFAALVPVTAGLVLWNDVRGAANGSFAQGTGAFLRPLMLPFALAVCGAVIFGAPRLLDRAPRLQRVTGALSRHSLGVYVIHPLLLTALGRLVMRPLRWHLPGSILTFLAITLGSLLGALLVSVLLARTPLALTIGEERVRRRVRHDGERELLGRREAREEPAAAR